MNKPNASVTKLNLTYTTLHYLMSIFNPDMTLAEMIASWKDNMLEFPERIEITKVRLVKEN